MYKMWEKWYITFVIYKELIETHKILLHGLATIRNTEKYFEQLDPRIKLQNNFNQRTR